jgi:hypothetical protein
MVEIGTKIEFNYGAMHPTEFGVVTKVKDSIATIRGAPLFRGDTGFIEEINLSCIKVMGETTVNGSPIGVWTI